MDVALHQKEGPVQLKTIAERQEISVHYLEQIVAPLVRAGLLRSTRGPSGGVTLGRAAHEIHISEVVEVLEGPITPVDCVDDPALCTRADLCVTCDMWTALKNAMVNVLESVTIQDLVERHQEKQIDGQG